LGQKKEKKTHQKKREDLTSRFRGGPPKEKKQSMETVYGGHGERTHLSGVGERPKKKSTKEMGENKRGGGSTRWKTEFRERRNQINEGGGSRKKSDRKGAGAVELAKASDKKTKKATGFDRENETRDEKGSQPKGRTAALEDVSACEREPAPFSGKGRQAPGRQHR